MGDPGTIIGALGLFIQLYDKCEILYRQYKLTRRFGTDYLTAQRQLRMQWSLFHEILKTPRILRPDRDPRRPECQNRQELEEYVRGMHDAFQDCHDLMEWYHGEDEKGSFFENPDQHKSLVQDYSSSQPTAIPTPAPVSESISRLPRSEKAERRRFWRRSNSRSVTPPAKLTRGSENIVGASVEAAATNNPASSKTSYWKKIEWARHDRHRFFELIYDLREGNRDLECYLRLSTLRDPVRELPDSEEIVDTWVATAKALAQLHGVLRKLNNGGYYHSLQLREDHNQTRDELSQALLAHEGLKLHDGSAVFNIQQHRSENLTDSSILFPIENIMDVADVREIAGSLPRIDQLTDLDDDGQNAAEGTTPGVVRKGYVENNQDPGSLLIWYRDNVGSWSTSFSLEEILKGRVYWEQMSPIQIVQLARTIAWSYLHLGYLRDSCTIPRPANYRFYHHSDEDCDWDESSPFVLSPWLSCGFGRFKKIKLGMGSGVQPVSNTYMVELGLVLFQVGAGRPVNYGRGGMGLENAKTYALDHAYVLDTSVGSRYATIIQGFLEFRRDSLGSSLESETDYVKKAISILRDLEAALSNTATAPLRKRPESDDDYGGAGGVGTKLHASHHLIVPEHNMASKLKTYSADEASEAIQTLGSSKHIPTRTPIQYHVHETGHQEESLPFRQSAKSDILTGQDQTGPVMEDGESLNPPPPYSYTYVRTASPFFHLPSLLSIYRLALQSLAHISHEIKTEALVRSVSRLKLWGAGSIDEPIPLDELFPVEDSKADVLRQCILDIFAYILFLEEQICSKISQTSAGEASDNFDSIQRKIDAMLGTDELYNFSSEMVEAYQIALEGNSNDDPKDLSLELGWISSSIECLFDSLSAIRDRKRMQCLKAETQVNISPAPTASTSILSLSGSKGPREQVRTSSSRQEDVDRKGFRFREHAEELSRYHPLF